MRGEGQAAADWTRTLLFKIDEKRCFLLLLVLFLVIAIAIALIPYNPAVDLADAQTNDIWIDHYARGVYHIPYNDWDFGRTQSVVVNYSGEYVVVNEKGPGHIMMMLPFHMMGIDFIFGPVMIAFAVFSTYMLGKRLMSWRVGFIASVFVLTNVTVLVMWYRSYWTDASTMHMLVLSFWLLVESNYWLNGRSLEPKERNRATRRQIIAGAGFGILSGLSFGASVSTRYATALILVEVFVYILAFYSMRGWPELRKGRISNAIKCTSKIWMISGMFVLGLMIVLVPLMQYNSAYFGSPFKSGYDATLIFQFQENNESLTGRDTSGSWSSDTGSMITNALSNLVALAPVLVSRMPGLIMLPLAIWLLRKRPDLWFLFIWIAINFFTYLSISWVDMYAGMPSKNLHEPRYWMPSVPSIALLAGLSLDRLIDWIVNRKDSSKSHEREKKRIWRVALTIFIVAIVALYGLIPAIGYFASIEPGGALSPGGQNPPDQAPNQPPKQPPGGQPLEIAFEFLGATPPTKLIAR